jgi:hypothetical protein
MKIVLVLSTVVLSVLLLGYFGTFGVVIARTSPPQNASAVKTTAITLDAGRVRIWTETNTTPRRTIGVTRPSMEWELWRPRFPDIRRSLWEFDNHTVVGSRAWVRADIVAFPIWCVALPFLIAPAMYLRRRLKQHREPAGFAVVGVAP